SDHHRGLAINFEPYGVVHTARRARPSIGERFDDEVAFLRDAAPQIFRRRLGKGRFAVAFDLYRGQPLTEMLGQAIHQHVAARLGDITHRAPPFYRPGAFSERAPYRHALIGWIADSLLHGSPSIRRLTLDEPIGPKPHPANTAENSPPSPPATIILIFAAER